MDNQYYYYNGNDGQGKVPSENYEAGANNAGFSSNSAYNSQGGAYNAQGSYANNGGYNTQAGYTAPTRVRRRKKTPKWVLALSLGLVFGLSAGIIFQGVNILSDQLLPKSAEESEATTESTSGTLTEEEKNVTKTTLTTGDATVVTSDVSGIVKEVMPSIVSITNMSVQQIQSFFGGAQEYEAESMGSGIIIGENSDEYLVVTNQHVIAGYKTLSVTFIDGQSIEANLKGADAAKDIAVVAVPKASVPQETKDAISVATLGDSDALQVGEPAIAIGNALGYGQSVTVGIISALNREVDGYDAKLIQTDAAINYGNSGGALLNVKGQVIGINSVKVAASAVEGMGYAIPMSDVSEIITNLMNAKTRTKVAEEERGYIGISGVDVSDETAELYNMPTGVYVSMVSEGGAAASAGLTKGTIITKLDGVTIDTLSTLQEQLTYYKAGEVVSLTVQVPTANGEYEEQVVELTLGARAQ